MSAIWSCSGCGKDYRVASVSSGAVFGCDWCDGHAAGVADERARLLTYLRTVANDPYVADSPGAWAMLHMFLRELTDGDSLKDPKELEGLQKQRKMMIEVEAMKMALKPPGPVTIDGVAYTFVPPEDYEP